MVGLELARLVQALAALGVASQLAAMPATLAERAGLAVAIPVSSLEALVASTVAGWMVL
jgi:hypothetical protein